MSAEAVEQQLQWYVTTAAKVAWVRTQASAGPKLAISKADAARLHDLLKGRQRQPAFALALAMAVTSGVNELVVELRRLGYFRSSRYGFNVGPIRELVSVLQGLGDDLGLEKTWSEYLASVAALYKLAPEAKRMRNSLLTRLADRRGKALKSLLAVVDDAFASGMMDSSDTCALGNGASDQSTIVSRIISLVQEEGGLRPQDLRLADSDVVSKFNGTYERAYEDARCIEVLHTAETMIDGLPYRAEDHVGGVVISSIDPDLEKSVRLGYIQMESQVALRQHHLLNSWADGDPSPPSIFELFEQYYDEKFSDYAEIKGGVNRRVTFTLTGNHDDFATLAQERLFKEDLLFLAQLSVEHYGDADADPVEVAPGLLAFDVLKVNRLFALISYVFRREFAKIEDAQERQRVIVHSSVFPLKRQQLLLVLGFVLPRDKAEKVLELLEMNESRAVVDLQYTPFIKVGDSYLLAPALIAHSNLVRNLAVLNGLNATRIKGKDPMQTAVAGALREAGFLVEEEVVTSQASKIGDTDIVAYKDGVLYLFECKNAYLPCNVHEMRNSYMHIEKGAKQLTLRMKKFAEDSHRDQIWAKLGWTVPTPTAIRTGILIANRVFTGATVEGHPVRQAHEFINVLLRGVVSADGTNYCVWDGDQVSTSDLDRYLGSDGLLADYFESLVPSNYGYDFGSLQVGFVSWKLAPEKLLEVTRARYTREVEHTA
ncbi:hypothetical protein [Stenotrophomonas sp. CFBP8980]|uniref:hypothetical protein n=1 Tax=Stenotrophomonas sp. CFBP8980 TaxID=3096523 RepID=UPI002A6B760E|nr:hypothetical protein [Stenotrophomonas sp. CFBP8980]MDY1032453.1 hypothetical protein [Stenotrophomonas sp. CFBP8980]